MESKKKIFGKLVPLAALEALTPEAALAVPQGMIIDGLITIRAFPYKIGRESRIQTVKGKIERCGKAEAQRS